MADSTVLGLAGALVGVDADRRALGVVGPRAESVARSSLAVVEAAPVLSLSDFLCKRCSVTSTAWGREMGTITHGER